MADEAVGAVLEAPVVESSPELDEGVSTESTPVEKKVDGRERTSFERARIAELRKLAAAETDPVKKSALEAERKHYYDRFGKLDAYESLVPTVREARELKQTLEAVGGREGVERLKTTLAEVEQVDAMLESGDPAVLERMFEEAPEGMIKLIPLALAKLAETNPEAYAKGIAPHAIQFFDTAGFPAVFDEMVQFLEADTAKSENLKKALAVAYKMAKWVQDQRKGTAKVEAPKTDPEKEALRKKLQERETKDAETAYQSGYNAEATYANGAIDKHLKPIVAKLGLSKEQYEDLRANVWTRLQENRNKDKGFLDLVNSSNRIEGVPGAMRTIRDYTDKAAREHAEYVAKFRYGHQLRNGAKVQKDATEPVSKGAVTTVGKQPKANEIDYGPKGKMVAVRQGYKNVQDMLLDGKAPLIAGGIRKWR